MQETRFHSLVREGADLGEDEERARAATNATLRTLGEALPENVADDVATQLPDDLATTLRNASDGEGESFDLDEFVRRVDERERESHNVEGDAERHVRAVTDALTRAVSGGQLEELRDHFPEEYDDLFHDVDVGEDPM